MRVGMAWLLACSAAAGLALPTRAASLQQSPAQAPAQRSADALAQAQTLIQSQQLTKANELLSELVRHDPGKTEALLELGQVQLSQALNEDAMSSFESVLAQDGQGPNPSLASKASPNQSVAAARDGEEKAALAAALADRKAGLDDSALVCLVRARKFLPGSPLILFAFGVQAEGMRIYEDADAALNMAHAISPDDAKILYALAHVELDEQKMPQAEAHLRAYLAARPQDATAHYGLGLLLHQAMKNEEARAELERSIALEPRQTGSYYELGEMALEQNQDADACDFYAKVLALAPQHGGALTGMGVLAFRAKDYASAESFLKSAVFYASDYPKAHHYYALVLSRLGRPAEADAENARATQLNEEQTRTRRGNFLEVIE